jgi:hypothetical protein
MKNDVVDYIARCMECQKVKDKHRHPTGLLLEDWLLSLMSTLVMGFGPED